MLAKSLCLFNNIGYFHSGEVIILLKKKGKEGEERRGAKEEKRGEREEKRVKKKKEKLTCAKISYSSEQFQQ